MARFKGFIKVNLPRSQREFESGNGEGVWAKVSDDVEYKHDNDHVGGTFDGEMANDSLYYPELKVGNPVRFTMRGNYRPVALLHGCLDQYKVISDEEHAALIRAIGEKQSGPVN